MFTVTFTRVHSQAPLTTLTIGAFTGLTANYGHVPVDDEGGHVVLQLTTVALSDLFCVIYADVCCSDTISPLPHTAYLNTFLLMKSIMAVL